MNNQQRTIGNRKEQFFWYMRIQRQGDGSYTVTIPKFIATELDIVKGDHVKVSLDDKRAIIEKI